MARTQRLRFFLDSSHPRVVSEASDLLERVFPHARVGRSLQHEGTMTILRVHRRHLTCLLPQHGRGMKHRRRVRLEPWQLDLITAASWSFLRGCINSDGCAFLNRTGPYVYLSYDFTNHSRDILDLFARICDVVGVDYRRYERRIRVYRRPSVAPMEAHTGTKG